jgi:hypothetical protein
VITEEMIDIDPVVVPQKDMVLPETIMPLEDVATLAQDLLTMIVADVVILALALPFLITTMLEDTVVPLLPVIAETCVLVPH